MPRTTLGRCPDCGESVEVTLNRGKPGTIALHGCRVRHCEHPGCVSREFPEAMFQVESGNWCCPAHALRLAARDLVALYRAEGEADWTAISEIISEVLPNILEKLDREEKATHP